MIPNRKKLKEATEKATETEILLSETGNRHLKGLPLKIFLGGCILWSLFQLWYASPFAVCV